MSPEEIAKLGVMTESEAAENAYARILVLGPAKAGKTTCLLASAPKALHINCDGQSASKGAKSLGAHFLTIDAFTPAQFKAALSAAEKLVASGDVKTIVLDTLTLLCDNVIDILDLQGLSGFDLWNEVADILVGGVKRLAKLDAHLFVVAHMSPEQDPAAGIMPAVKGASKVRIPALLDDWILLDVEPGRKPERQFLLGPQKTWSHSGRNVRRSVAVDANVPALFEELGLKL